MLVGVVSMSIAGNSIFPSVVNQYRLVVIFAIVTFCTSAS
jgi:hypothetical protein